MLALFDSERYQEKPVSFRWYWHRGCGYGVADGYSCSVDDVVIAGRCVRRRSTKPGGGVGCGGKGLRSVLGPPFCVGRPTSE